MEEDISTEEWHAAVVDWTNAIRFHEIRSKRRAIITLKRQLWAAKRIYEAFERRGLLVRGFKKLRKRYRRLKFRKLIAKFFYRHYLKKWKNFSDRSPSESVRTSSQAFASFKWISLTLGRQKPNYAIPWGTISSSPSKFLISGDEGLQSFNASRFREYVMGRMAFRGASIPLMVHAVALLDARQLR